MSFPGGNKRKLEDHKKPQIVPKRIKTNNYWTLGLISSMKDPDLLIYEDDKICIIEDKYPKAKCHYLVIPKEDIESLKTVRKEHIPLLIHMNEMGKKIVQEKYPEKKIKSGYHSEASMFRLHLHIISDDMKSDFMRTRKHWNSFNSKFFLSSNDVIEKLKSVGKLYLPSSEECEQLLKAPLKCNRCGYIPVNFPALKGHIIDKH